jgi:hypothetical protein
MWKHLLIPLVVGLILNVIVAKIWPTNQGEGSWRQLYSRENAVFVAGVILTYLLLMYYQTTKDTSFVFRGTELAKLDEALSDATNYFALGTLRTAEWFDPISQVFLARITKRRLQGGFRDERILLLADRRDEQDLDLLYLEGYYAKRLIEIHESWGTPLAFLRAAELREVLAKLGKDNQRKLLLRDYWRRCPKWLVQRLPLSWNIRRLDLAVIGHSAGSKSVLLVRKENEELRVDHLTSSIDPYINFVEQIRNVIYKPGSQELNAAHDFTKYY